MSLELLGDSINGFEKGNRRIVMTTPLAIRNLFNQYPAIIEQMPMSFSAHQFILRLAHENQVDYINALSVYRERLMNGHPAPFMILHGILAKRLRALPRFVRYAGNRGDSHDIFEQPEGCSIWEKI